jgi:hypothetical protein
MQFVKSVVLYIHTQPLVCEKKGLHKAACEHSTVFTAVFNCADLVSSEAINWHIKQ